MGDEMAEVEAFSDTSEVEKDLGAQGDDVPEGLSYVGGAAYTALRDRHPAYRGVCWNLSHGRVVGEIAQTPDAQWFERPITDRSRESHSDGFVDRMAGVMSRGTEFVDFASLGAPDGKFLDKIAKAFRSLHESGSSVTIRFLTGNIIGMPTDNAQLLKDLIKYLPDEGTSLKIWVGSWRKGLSWNHSKIVAVDGKYLFQGGHNVWDPHYLKWDPVRDVSMEAEGQVAQDGHIFINRMWAYIEKKEREWKSTFGSADFKPMLMQSMTGVRRWPTDIEEFPPAYDNVQEPLPFPDALAAGDIPMLTIGRYGELHHNPDTANPSDSAITEMLASAQRSIKLCLQDLGPIALPMPSGPMAIPGGVWPKAYLRSIATAIYERGVDVHIIVSTPNSIPANLSPTEANYGNGWTVHDVASEIVKSIKQNFPDAEDDRLSGLVTINLKVCYMRSSGGNSDWSGKGGKAGNHAKFFIVDDRAYYIGSQNLYIANLAEWGIIIDDEEQTKRVLDEYWNRIWALSWERVPEEERDLDVVKVLRGAGYERNTPPDAQLDEEMWEQFLLKKQGAALGGPNRNLVVWLIRATGLRDADGLGSGSSDSYVRLRVVDQRGKIIGHPWESRVIWDGGSDPEWNEQVTFEGLDKPAAYTLKISVLDKDSLLGLKGGVADWLADDDRLGSGEVKLCTLAKTMAWQHKDVIVMDGFFSDSVVKIALNTGNGWGN